MEIDEEIAGLIPKDSYFDLEFMTEEKCFLLVDKFILKTYSEERKNDSYSTMLYLTWMMKNHLSVKEIILGIEQMERRAKLLKD